MATDAQIQKIQDIFSGNTLADRNLEIFIQEYLKNEFKANWEDMGITNGNAADGWIGEQTAQVIAENLGGNLEAVLNAAGSGDQAAEKFFVAMAYQLKGERYYVPQTPQFDVEQSNDQIKAETVTVEWLKQQLPHITDEEANRMIKEFDGDDVNLRTSVKSQSDTLLGIAEGTFRGQNTTREQVQTVAEGIIALNELKSYELNDAAYYYAAGKKYVLSTPNDYAELQAAIANGSVQTVHNSAGNEITHTAYNIEPGVPVLLSKDKPDAREEDLAAITKIQEDVLQQSGEISVQVYRDQDGKAPPAPQAPPQAAAAAALVAAEQTAHIPGYRALDGGDHDGVSTDLELLLLGLSDTPDRQAVGKYKGDVPENTGYTLTATRTSVAQRIEAEYLHLLNDMDYAENGRPTFDANHSMNRKLFTTEVNGALVNNFTTGEEGLYGNDTKNFATGVPPVSLALYATSAVNPAAAAGIAAGEFVAGKMGLSISQKEPTVTTDIQMELLLSEQTFERYNETRLQPKSSSISTLLEAGTQDTAELKAQMDALYVDTIIASRNMYWHMPVDGEMNIHQIYDNYNATVDKLAEKHPELAADYRARTAPEATLELQKIDLNNPTWYAQNGVDIASHPIAVRGLSEVEFRQEMADGKHAVMDLDELSEETLNQMFGKDRQGNMQTHSMVSGVMPMNEFELRARDLGLRGNAQERSAQIGDAANAIFSNNESARAFGDMVVNRESSNNTTAAEAFVLMHVDMINNWGLHDFESRAAAEAHVFEVLPSLNPDQPDSATRKAETPDDARLVLSENKINAWRDGAYVASALSREFMASTQGETADYLVPASANIMTEATWKDLEALHDNNDQYIANVSNFENIRRGKPYEIGRDEDGQPILVTDSKNYANVMMSAIAKAPQPQVEAIMRPLASNAADYQTARTGLDTAFVSSQAVLSGGRTPEQLRTAQGLETAEEAQRRNRLDTITAGRFDLTHVNGALSNVGVTSDEVAAGGIAYVAPGVSKEVVAQYGLLANADAKNVSLLTASIAKMQTGTSTAAFSSLTANEAHVFLTNTLGDPAAAENVTAEQNATFIAALVETRRKNPAYLDDLLDRYQHGVGPAAVKADDLKDFEKALDEAVKEANYDRRNIFSVISGQETLNQFIDAANDNTKGAEAAILNDLRAWTIYPENADGTLNRHASAFYAGVESNAALQGKVTSSNLQAGELAAFAQREPQVLAVAITDAIMKNPELAGGALQNGGSWDNGPKAENALQGDFKRLINALNDVKANAINGEPLAADVNAVEKRLADLVVGLRGENNPRMTALTNLIAENSDLQAAIIANMPDEAMLSAQLQAGMLTGSGISTAYDANARAQMIVQDSMPRGPGHLLTAWLIGSALDKNPRDPEEQVEGLPDCKTCVPSPPTTPAPPAAPNVGPGAA